jgi:hypothetical protein
MTSFYQALENSYKSNKKQKQNMNGYVRDNQLSNTNEQVYYNPNSKKMLYSVAGTKSLADVGTDIYLGLGMLKSTRRYKEADKILKQAKEKYHPSSTTLTGHSLAGSIVSGIASRGAGDKVLTLDKGSAPFQKTRSLERSYRTKGDLVSILNKNSKRTTTLKTPNSLQTNPISNALNSHLVSNIKNSGIFI